MSVDGTFVARAPSHNVCDKGHHNNSCEKGNHIILVRRKESTVTVVTTNHNNSCEKENALREGRSDRCGLYDGGYLCGPSLSLSNAIDHPGYRQVSVSTFTRALLPEPVPRSISGCPHLHLKLTSMVMSSRLVHDMVLASEP